VRITFLLLLAHDGSDGIFVTQHLGTGFLEIRSVQAREEVELGVMVDPYSVLAGLSGLSLLGLCAIAFSL
jgi:hypothetical protein